MTRERWTVFKILAWTTEHFRTRSIENPRLEAEVLLADVMGVDRAGLYLTFDKPLKEGEQQVFREMIQRRDAGEPIAYITGRKEFWSLRFKVDPDCLIPRPETELLVEEAIRIGKEMPGPLRVLDIGVGCGAVAIALATELEQAHIVATDISSHTLSLAQENACEHGVEERIRFVHNDLLPSGEAPFGLIVSNPPYIPTAQILHLAPEVRDYEPLIALDGGGDGLRFFRQIAQGARGHLIAGGWLIMEMGEGQASQVADIVAQEGLTHNEVITDYAGLKRVIRAQKA